MEAASEVGADYEIHFRQSDKKLRMHAAAPMWRNGRRNGLKIRSREKRGMGSTPIIGTSINVILLGKSSQIRICLYRESSRKKTHESTVCVSTIRQLNLTNRAGDDRALHACLESAMKFVSRADTHWHGSIWRR